MGSSTAAGPSAAGHAAVHFGFLDVLGGRDVAEGGTGRGGYGDRGGLLDEDFGGRGGGAGEGGFVAAGDAAHDDGLLALQVRGRGRREGWAGVDAGGEGDHRVAEIQLFGAFAGGGAGGVVADAAGAAVLGLDHGGDAGGGRGG